MSRWVGLTARVTAVALLATSGLVGAGAASATDPVYPTWNDVQQAKSNEQAAAAEAQHVSDLLSGLTQQAADAGTAAILAAAKAQTAEQQLTDAQSRLDGLQSRLTAAQAEQQAAKQQAAQFVGEATRTQDPAMQLWLSGDDDALLSKLTTLGRLNDHSVEVLARVTQLGNETASLARQAASETTVRDGLARTAKQESDAAVAAQRQADEAVASTQAQHDTLVAQLASLHDTSVQTAAAYQQGVDARAAAAEEARKKAAAAAAAAAASRGSSGSGGGGGSGGSSEGGGSGGRPFSYLLGLSPGPDSLSSADARSYAGGLIGAYGWGGDQNTCLGWLWTRESGWRWNAYNTSSEAYGIAQSLPASKYASTGSDWMTSSKTQIRWGLDYIQRSYGSPCNAWNHETHFNWY